MNALCRTHERVISQIWMRHVAHKNESCHTYEWVMSHKWTRHVSSCHTYKWVMSHICMRHVTHMNESDITYGKEAPNTRVFRVCVQVLYHTHAYTHTQMEIERLKARAFRRSSSREWVMSQIWMSHVTHTNELDLTDGNRAPQDKDLSCVYVNESCRIYECVMSHRWK